MPFELNERGAAETDSTLRVLKHSRVFALGDVSGIHVAQQEGALPATAQVRAPDWSTEALLLASTLTLAWPRAGV